jgi:hypothetical protein
MENEDRKPDSSLFAQKPRLEKFKRRKNLTFKVIQQGFPAREEAYNPPDNKI